MSSNYTRSIRGKTDDKYQFVKLSYFEHWEGRLRRHLRRLQDAVEAVERDLQLLRSQSEEE